MGLMQVRREYVKLISKERKQCPDCSNFYEKRQRPHKCLKTLQQFKWPKLGARVFCLLCMKVRESKAALARHYLACHSMHDLQTHLGINAHILFFALRPDLLEGEGTKSIEMQVEAIEHDEP